MGVAVLSVGFGVGHYNQGWDAVVTTGALGLLWAVMYLRAAAALRHRQPRRFQFDRGAAGRNPWSVGGRTYLMFGTSTSMRARRLWNPPGDADAASGLGGRGARRPHRFFERHDHAVFLNSSGCARSYCWASASLTGGGANRSSR